VLPADDADHGAAAGAGPLLRSRQGDAGQTGGIDRLLAEAFGWSGTVRGGAAGRVTGVVSTSNRSLGCTPARRTSLADILAPVPGPVPERGHRVCRARADQDRRNRDELFKKLMSAP